MKKSGRAKPTAAQDLRHTAARDLGCINHPGTPASIHHCRENLGMGQAVNHDDFLNLCFYCHQDSSAGNISIHFNPIAFRKKYGTETQLMEKLNLMLREISY